MKLETQLVAYDAAPGDPHTPLVTPLYQTATFVQASATEPGAYDYSRSGNPTRAVLEAQLAGLEAGEHGFAFASGMAALSAVTRLVASGEEIVAGLDMYGGTYRLLSQILPPSGIRVRYVDTTDLAEVTAALGERTRLLLVESPSNPLLQISDLRALSRLARQRGTWLAVDNSVMTPCRQRPLELGADLVIHSATKFLSGHSDVTGGAVVVRDPVLAERLYLIQNGEGTALAPFDCWLLLRGLKTLALRIERQQASAVTLVERLERDPRVRRVYYPAGDPIHEVQASGPGSMLSFETGDLKMSQRMVEATRLFRTCVSFGSVNSSISLPAWMSHASTPEDSVPGRSLARDLVRVSVGIEALDDLASDLERALRVASPELVAAVG